MSDLLIERYPVNAEHIGGEIKSTNIAFEDYSRMSTYTHKLSVGRRLAAPFWSLNDDQIFAVIVRGMEARANFRKMQKGLNMERLARAQQLIEKMRPELTARIDRLCARLVAAKREGADDVTVAGYGQKVTEVDTQLRLLSDTPKILAGVIYFYWRVGFTSVETGQQLGLKPPHVRQLLSRMLDWAGELGYAPPEVIVARPAAKKNLNRVHLDYEREARADLHRAEIELRKGQQLQQVIALRKAGKFTVDIAKELGLGAHGSELVTRLLVQAGLR